MIAGVYATPQRHVSVYNDDCWYPPRWRPERERLLVDHCVRLSGQTMALQIALPPLVCVLHSIRTSESACVGLMSMPGMCNDVGRQPCWCMNLCDIWPMTWHVLPGLEVCIDSVSLGIHPWNCVRHCSHEPCARCLRVCVCHLDGLPNPT